MYQFTQEDRIKGGKRRYEVLSPEKRRELAIRANYRRWYKPTADDVDRIDRHLKNLAKLMAVFLTDEDYDRALRVIVAMAPYERMKIGLNSNVFNVTPIEDSPQVEAKLAESRNRRNKALTDEVEVQGVDNQSRRPPDTTRS